MAHVRVYIPHRVDIMYAHGVNVHYRHCVNPHRAYTVNHALWAAAHTAQFAAPGWHYLGQGSGVGYLEGGGTYVALTNGAAGLTLVVEKLDRSSSQCAYARSPPNTTIPEVSIFLDSSFSICSLCLGPFHHLLQLYDFYYYDFYDLK